MKVILVNGSPHKSGCTYTALCEVEKSLQEQGMETEIFHVGLTAIQDCIGCGSCNDHRGKCVYDKDSVNIFIEKAKEADGFIFGSPVYYAHPSGRILSFMDRAFYAGKEFMENKPAAIVVSGRRAGTTASIDAMTKHLTINNMPVVSANYWNMVHGNQPDEVKQDLEGMQVMRILGQNMAWLIKCIEAGKQAGIEVPQRETKIYTNFIR